MKVWWYMMPHKFRCLAVLSILVILCPRSLIAGDWPFRLWAKPDLPNSMEQLARSIDSIEDKVLDDGTVVIKQPDVYGQSRMSLYRKNFETQLYNAIGQFNFVLSARVIRTDQAAFQSQTFLSNALSSGGGTPSSGRGGRSGKSSAASMNATTVVAPAAAAASPAPSGGGGSDDDLSLPQLEAGSIDRTTKPFGYGTSAFQGINTNYGGFGLEPTVYLDQLKNYQDHLNRIRRVNMGDDIADSPGYALYQIRMPVSIQPGECTRKGHGAVLTATIHHEFGADFLETTFRNLAINDLVDQLGPLIYELIRNGYVDQYVGRNVNYQYYYKEHYAKQLARKQVDQRELLKFIEKIGKSTNEENIIESLKPAEEGRNENERNQNERNENELARTIAESETRRYRTTRANTQEYGVAPSDYNDVFLSQNIYLIAANVRDRLSTKVPRANEVNSYLRREFEAAYKLLPHFESLVRRIAQDIEDRDFYALKEDYINLARMLPGDLQFGRLPQGAAPADLSLDPGGSLVRTLTMLSYWVAVECGLLNEQLRHDIHRVSAGGGFACPNLDTMEFFAHVPRPEAEQAFHDYVKARWPIIAFALDPVTDEQNIADASSIRRDLQLALAFAFSSGQIRFRQFLQYQKRIEQDSETIALNRTVTTFIHGHETFGFRFYPRYQNPPLERSNFSALYNQLIKGSPGRNYQVRNSKLEPGQRELSAVVIMPSFLPAVRMDLTGNWFPLVDPDEMEIPTERMLAQGRKVVELRNALGTAIDCGEYRKNDLERLVTRVDQIEAMLPMQTRIIRVPYENLLGGFPLFQQGVTSLVPKLLGFDGVDVLDGEDDVDILLYGKHFSVQETKVVVGGKYLSPVNLDVERLAAAVKEVADANAKAADPTTDPAQPAKTQEQNAADAKATQKAATAVKAMSKAAGEAAKGAAKAQKLAAPGSPPTTGNTGADNVNVEVISRETMRIRIPADAKFSRIKDANGSNTYVEVYVATPNGISNSLLIPYDKAKKKKQGAGTGQTATATFKASGAIEATITGPVPATHELETNKPRKPKQPQPAPQSPTPSRQHDSQQHQGQGASPPSHGSSPFKSRRATPEDSGHLTAPSDPAESTTTPALPPLPMPNPSARRDGSTGRQGLLK
jgi:hypothetical protein